jgi:hypothetical protein
MMLRIAVLLAVLFVAAAPAVAQPPGCTPGGVVLQVLPDTPIAPGTPIQVSVTGDPGDFVLLFQGPNLGSTTLSFGPLAGTTICLATPFFPIPLGMIPASGTKMVMLPTGFFTPSGSTRNYQAVTFTPMSPTPAPDTSNLDSITFAGPTTCTPGNVMLSVTPDVPVQPGDTITISVTGTPGSFVLLFSGPHPGATTLPFFGGGTTICLDFPFFAVPFGMIPASGTVSHSHMVPASAPLPLNITRHFQALTITPPMPVTIDTSNTDTLQL